MTLFDWLYNFLSSTSKTFCNRSYFLSILIGGFIFVIMFGFKKKVGGFLKNLLKTGLFYEKMSEFSHGLICFYKLFVNNKLNTKYLLLYPFKQMQRSKFFRVDRKIYFKEEIVDPPSNILNKRAIDPDTEHIILFKSHGTSIYSMAENFRLDQKAIDCNFAIYIPEYNYDYFSSDIDIPYYIPTKKEPIENWDYSITYVGVSSSSSDLQNSVLSVDNPDVVKLNKMNLRNLKLKSTLNHQVKLSDNKLKKNVESIESEQNTNSLTEETFVKRSMTHFDHLAASIESISIKIFNKYQKRPHLIGFSLGCAMLLQSVVTNNLLDKNLFDKIILLAPFRSLNHHFKDRWLFRAIFQNTLIKHYEFDNERALELIQKYFWEKHAAQMGGVSKNIQEDVESRKCKNIKSEDTKEKIQTTDEMNERVVIFHGLFDSVIPCKVSEHLSIAYGIELKTYPVDHCELARHPTIWKDINCWIRKS
ncbi:hypothetical protein M153_3510002495 [Pseudoloma neurophilia]|uniref:Uncharacterized protein n=1 Tax=Pseudoloma neurophilia TaxID=146866 RepID=A0A0R0M735_9MICR|nr:hypothetical protein M153_3510002495 [Pseudoloma neurophilia]